MKRKTKYPGVTQVGARRFELRAQVRVLGSRTWKTVRRVVEAAGVEEAAAEHQQLRTELQKASTAGRTVLPTRPTLSVYARSWLKRQVERARKPSTLARYVEVLEKAILPVLGHRKVDEIRKQDVEDWLSWASKTRKRGGRPRAPETINGWLRLLKTLLRDAISDLDIPRDPTARVGSLPATPTRVTDEQPNSLASAELRKVMQALEVETPEVRAMCCVGFLTGMRFGELTALEWHDIHEDERTIHIRRAQWKGKVSTPKTGKSRTVALHQIALDALRAHRIALVDRSLPVLGAALVFPGKKGKYHFASFLQKALDRILRRAGVERHLSPHGMRRTFNNLMRLADVDRAVLHATVGHSSDKMTEHYSHVAVDEKLAAVEQFVRRAELVPPPIDSDQNRTTCCPTAPAEKVSHRGEKP